jgi:hypothetical protein
MSAANELPFDHPLLVSSLEAAGWQGTDASLEISLFWVDRRRDPLKDYRV